MSKKSATKRIDRLEGICIGAGLLLQKLQARYGADFGVGIEEQVRQCINDCRQVEQARQQRQASAAEKQQKAA